MKEQEIEKLVHKFLKGNASPEEIRTLEQLERNAEKKIVGKVFSSVSEERHTKSNIWNRIKRRTIKPFPKKRIWYGAAASILLLVGLGSLRLYYHASSDVTPTTVTNHQEAPLIINLKDGTKVTLNQNAQLSYPDLFNEEKRHISLRGEAFFEVAKNQNKPFIIKTGELFTRVVGTEFNVKAADSVVQVTVTEGAVEVYNLADTLNLQPDNQAHFNKVSGELKKNTVKSYLYHSWLKEDITLNDVTIEELGVVLESLYHYKIVPQNKEAGSKRLSTNLKRNESIDSVIERINYVNEVQLTKKSNNIIEVKLS